MNQLIREISNKSFRATNKKTNKAVLFKFKKVGQKVVVTEVGLTQHNKMDLVCEPRLGDSDNWLLLKDVNETNVYTMAVHRLYDGDFELFISTPSGRDMQFDLEEVDSRYEDGDYYNTRRASLKRERVKPTKYESSDEDSSSYY